MNSSRASSGLDLHVPSADEINLLIETMHSAVKAEQDLFHQTMYLYGASGSDLLLLSSEDGDDDGNGEDDDNDNEDEEEDGGLDGDGLLSTGDDASSTVRPLSSATTSVSGTAGGPSTRPKKTQSQTAAGDSTAPTKAVRTPRGGSQPPVPSHVQAGSPSRRQGRTAAQQPQQPAQAQPPHLSYATSPSSRRHGSLSRAHPSATMAAGNSAYNRSYISDLSMSSRYTQNSLEERGLIDPERGYPAPPAPSDLPVSSPRHHHHHHLHAHLYHPPHAVGPGAGGLPPPLGGYATEESVVVASLPAIDGRQRGGSAPTKEEEDHLLDIIVGLIPSPSTNVHKSYRGSPTARSRSNRLSLTQSTNAAGGGGGGSETASVVSVSRQRPSLRSEVDATHDTDADVDSLASPTTIASDHGGGAPSPRPPSGTSLPPGVEEIPSHPSKRPTHRYLIGYVACRVLLCPPFSNVVLFCVSLQMWVHVTRAHGPDRPLPRTLASSLYIHSLRSLSTAALIRCGVTSIRFVFLSFVVPPTGEHDVSFFFFAHSLISARFIHCAAFFTAPTASGGVSLPMSLALLFCLVVESPSIRGCFIWSVLLSG